MPAEPAAPPARTYLRSRAIQPALPARRPDDRRAIRRPRRMGTADQQARRRIPWTQDWPTRVQSAGRSRGPAQSAGRSGAHSRVTSRVTLHE
jgi:hypothetical protein